MDKEKSKYCDGGEIFCIPLFMPKDDWKLTTKLSKEDYDKNFAFGRAISDEKGSGILVEIFKKTSNIVDFDINEIVNSGQLFPPIRIFWIGIRKKRWKIIAQTPDYDKYKDSDYNNINLVLGAYDDLRLYNLGTNLEKKITIEQAQRYKGGSVIWFPINLENLIIEELNKLKSAQIR